MPEYLRSVEMSSSWHLPHIPNAIAEAFVHERLSHCAIRHYQVDRGSVSVLFEETSFRLNHAPVLLTMNHVSPNTLHDDVSNFIEFHYSFTAPYIQPVGPNSLASLHLTPTGTDRFELKHRYVQPDIRRSELGLGSKLVQTAEVWLKQVANHLGRPVTVFFNAGQRSVFQWAEKNGYRVDNDQVNLRRELAEHPDRFIQDKVFVSQESRLAGIMKDPYTFPKNEKGRYMENAVRLRFSKVIENDLVL